MASARGFARHRILIALPCLLAGAPVLADDAGAPPAQPSTQGAIIYARDVSHDVGAQHFPGQSHSVVTAPTGAIIGAIGLGLAPLTDSETARVTGSVPQALLARTMASLETLTATIAGPQGGALRASESASLSPGSAIAGGMQALSGALGSLSVIDGGRP